MAVMLDTVVIVRTRMPVLIGIGCVVHMEMRRATQIEIDGGKGVKRQHQQQESGNRRAPGGHDDAECTPPPAGLAAAAASDATDPEVWLWRAAILLVQADYAGAASAYRRILVVGGSALIAVIAALWLVERSLDVKLAAAAAAAVHSSPFGLCRSHHDRETQSA